MATDAKDQISVVAIYVRVSSDQQREAHTIDSQRSTLKTYAEERGYVVFKQYEDEGFSGSSIAGRPEFKQLLEDIPKQKFQAILVVEHNRITRSENPEETGMIIRILMENNIRIISPAEGILDLNRPPDELVAMIKLWISKEEKKEIIRKTMRGKLEKLRKGGWVAGKPPFGYKYDKEKIAWSVNEEEAALIRWMVDKFISEGWSLNRIIVDLMERDIRGKHGKFWQHATLNYMLRSPAYKGELWTNKNTYKQDPKTGTTRFVEEKPESEWIKIPVPAIIQPNEWEAVQRQLDDNRNVGRPTTDNSCFLLKGMVVCGHCGARLQLQRGAREQDKYYVCHNRRAPWHKRSNETRERCQLPYVPAKALDDMIMNYVLWIMTDTTFVLSLLTPESCEKSIQELQQKKAEAEIEINRHKERESRLINLYVDGNYDKAMLDQKRDGIRNLIETRTKDLEQYQDEILQLENSSRQRKRVEKELVQLKVSLGEYLQNRFDLLDATDRRRLLDLIIRSAGERIVLSKTPTLFDFALANIDIKWKVALNFSLMQQAAHNLNLGMTFRKALEETKRVGIFKPQDELAAAAPASSCPSPAGQ
jgi:site-specific DNA recombinase